MDHSKRCVWVSSNPVFWGLSFLVSILELEAKKLTITLFNQINFLLVVCAPEEAINEDVEVVLRL